MEPVEQRGAIEVAGRRLAWRSVGNGPPLALINGYSGAADGWDPSFLAGLARAFEVICPDNRGIGDSELGELDGPLTVEAMAADIEALLDARGIERLPVAGWSMGGFVAQALATAAPRRVEALILLASDPGGSEAVPVDREAFFRLTDHTGTPREQATRLIGLLFPAAVAAEMDREVGDLVAAERAALSPEALRAQRQAMATWSEADRPRPAAGDEIPVLVACGSEDAVIAPENAQRLAAHWGECRVEVFADCGHAFMAQEPERLADLVTSFLHG